MRSFGPVHHFRPSGHVPITTVLWDMDSCPLPDSFSPCLAGRSIRSALKNSGYLGPVTITATFNLDLNPRTADLLEPLFSSGINLSSIFGYCLPQLLFAWRMSAQPPANLMLICGDTTLETLSESLFCICDEGCTILVAHHGRKPVSADLWKSFLSLVSRDWIWESFLGSADDKDEALEYKCRETGYVSCEMCEFYGYSLEDLATHFSSDEHLEEVSDRTPLDKHSSSTSAVEPKGNERETKTEHVGEQETSCAPRGTKRPAAHIGPSGL
ncbi:hypothetical protein Rs2_02402 [Raphanus sativus]|nr:hypothetical protein Rs2_02402 [Raphanus sativus]